MLLNARSKTAVSEMRLCENSITLLTMSPRDGSKYKYRPGVMVRPKPLPFGVANIITRLKSTLLSRPEKNTQNILNNYLNVTPFCLYIIKTSSIHTEAKIRTSVFQVELEIIRTTLFTLSPRDGSR